jgi:outer membrane protein
LRNQHPKHPNNFLESAVRNGGWLLVSVACAAILAGPARAEGPLELYRIALQNDPRVAAARFDYLASQKARRAALAGLLPTVVLDSETTHERQRILSSQNAVIGAGFSKFPIDVWTLTITQPIIKLQAWQRLDQAEAAERQALAQQVAAEQALVVRVATAYLGVLAAQDSVSFATAERVAIGQQLQLAQERVARGLATVVNLHDAQARFAQTEAQEIDAKAVLDDALQAMREILGKLPQSYRQLAEDIPLMRPDPPDVNVWLDAAQKGNPGLDARRAAAEVAQAEMRRQRAGHAPTLDLVGTQINRKQGGTLFGGGSHVETSDLSLKFNLPIYTGGLITAVTEEAALRHSKTLEEVEAESRAVDRLTRSSYLGVISAISRVQALRQGVVSQSSALKAKQESFRAGLLTLIGVLDAERDLYLVRRDYAKARYDYLVNRLRLKQATGALSESDLEQLDSLLK